MNFIDSKWCKRALNPDNQEKIIARFKKWSKKGKDSDILKKAEDLYEFFISPNVATTDKVIVAGAILYIVTPIDAIPDFAPFAGFLDDLGVAYWVLDYINQKLQAAQQSGLALENTQTEEI